MSAQQQVQLGRPAAQLQQQQQQQPWWAGPLQGMGAALQGLQHNMQQLASHMPKPPGGPMQRPSSSSQPPQGPASTHSSSRSGSSSLALHRAPMQGAVSHSTASSVVTTAAAAATAAADAQPSKWSKQQPKLVTKEELGRATWVFLHTLAAQFPERPTRQQQRDARQLVDSLTRIYPCADCAQHFQEIVRRDPPDVSSRITFSQWMCRVHNTVNRRLGKPTFNCDLVGARWAPLDCDEHNSCDLTVGRPK